MSVTIIRMGRRKKAHIVTEWGMRRVLSACGRGYDGRTVAVLRTNQGKPYERFIRYDGREEAHEAIERAIAKGIMCMRCVRNTT